jgi:hypothetical protein
MIFISFLNKILLSGKKSQRYQWIDHRRRLARYYCSLIEKLYGLPMLCTADFVFRYVLSGCVRGQTNGVTLRRDSRPIHHLQEGDSPGTGLAPLPNLCIDCRCYLPLIFVSVMFLSLRGHITSQRGHAGSSFETIIVGNSPTFQEFRRLKQDQESSITSLMF